MILSLIAAMTDDHVIGKDNKLPWRFSEDLKHFKRVTMGHPVVMGRKTYESIGKALPGRENIVLTRRKDFAIPPMTVMNSLDSALEALKEEEEVFVIGGGTVFAEALPKANRLYLTVIHEKIAGDTYFPSFDLNRDFRVLETVSGVSAGDKPLRYSFVKAERVR